MYRPCSAPAKRITLVTIYFIMSGKNRQETGKSFLLFRAPLYMPMNSRFRYINSIFMIQNHRASRPYLFPFFF